MNESNSSITEHEIKVLRGIWRGMMFRCYNKTSNAYHNYGARGITVCLGWRSDQAKFVRDMYPRIYDTTMDRIDNDKGYTCGDCEECKKNGWVRNCQWASKSEQAKNRRDSVYLTIHGEERHISDWASVSGIKSCTITMRLERGWTPEQAVGMAKRINPLTSALTYGGVTLPLKEMAAKHGLTHICLKKRLDRGMPLEEALSMKRSGRGGDSVNVEIHTLSNGDKGTIKELAAKHNQVIANVYARLNLGWTLSEAMRVDKRQRPTVWNKKPLPKRELCVT